MGYSTVVRIELFTLGEWFVLNFDLYFNLKHIPSNKAVKHDVLGDYIICVESSEGYGEALRPAKTDCFR